MSARSLNWIKFGGLVALAFALGLLFAGLLDLPSRGSAQQLTARPVIAPVQAPPLPEAKPLQDLSQAFAAVADAVRPSVVYIRASHTERQPDRRLPPGFEQFFPRGPRQPEFQQGAGSGFIVSSDGYIITNNHVVDEAQDVTVRLLDRREFKARVIGTDANTDIAVLKIDAKGLKPAALGNSDNEKIGSWVLAVGNPLIEGLTFTVTSGIISAKGRRLGGLNPSQLSISDFIQTDAAINPGNSGGPLVNVRGEVIGVNSAIASQTGFYSGYGFAIPINLARNVMNQLITDGKVHRAALGVSIDDADQKDAQYVGLTEVTGVVIKDIAEPARSAAYQAGIRAGDVIVAIDGKPVERTGQLQQEVGFRKPGETVRVDVMRKGGVRKTFEVKLQPLTETEQIAQAEEDSSNAQASPAGTSLGRLGLSVEPVTPTLARQLEIPADRRGLIVTEVVPGGPAWQEVLPPQGGGPDIILSVEGKAVRTEAELREALRDYQTGDIVTLALYNAGNRSRRIVRIQLAGE